MLACNIQTDANGNLVDLYVGAFSEIFDTFKVLFKYKFDLHIC
jgi:hypothetical protein